MVQWCIHWLAQLKRGEMVVVNLRPASEDETEFVRFDHARVLCVLARIASDLDVLARQGPAAAMERPEESADPRTRPRRRLAASEEKPRGRTAREQRDASCQHFAGVRTAGIPGGAGSSGGRICCATSKP